MPDDEVARSLAPTPLLADEDRARLPQLLAEREAQLAAHPRERDDEALVARLRDLLAERRRTSRRAPRRVFGSLLPSDWEA